MDDASFYQSTDLEIYLYRGDRDGYSIELRFSDPGSQVLQAPVRGSCAFDLTGLLSKAIDPQAYGQALSASLFCDAAVAGMFRLVRAAAQQTGKNLRLRLFIDPGAAELHGLNWEMLLDPQDQKPLITQPGLSFSRFLSSDSWEHVKLRARNALRALVFVASPKDINRFLPGFAPIGVDAEVQRACQGLGTISPVIITSSDAQPGQASMENLAKTMRQGFDILYLVCHGALARVGDGRREPQPFLLMETEDGSGRMASGEDLVEGLRGLEPDLRPRLVVLVSCQSAKGSASDGEGALAALGPRLARVGIPAVLAMQGMVSMETIAHFMPAFFEKLSNGGRVDQAVTVGRAAVRSRPDWWMPVLFMRLKDGLIWYVPGFHDQYGHTVEFKKWPALVSSIQDGRCTPIIGPGLLEPVIGSYREIAQYWSKTFHYPLASYERDSLPQIAQYLAVDQDRPFLVKKLVDTLREKVSARLRTVQQSGPLSTSEAAFAAGPSPQLLSQAGMEISRQDPLEPHRALASLPLSIYITTNLDHWMEKALEEVRKYPPVVEVLPWNEELIRLYKKQSYFALHKEYRPSVDQPLVYHLFGHLDLPESIVLTEDDYFDFLKGIAHISGKQSQSLIPAFVQRILSDSALLFLGYQMEDWNFRVLFRSIVDMAGEGRISRYSHIAVQIMPEVGRLIAPDRALLYLEQYLTKGAQADISMFLGSPKEFIQQLMEKVSASPSSAG